MSKGPRTIQVPDPEPRGELLRCPDCGRFQITKHQYETHWRTAHGRGKPRVRPCLNCREDFHDNYHPEQKFCSPECAQEALWGRRP